jgi:hypothetical protein
MFSARSLPRRFWCTVMLRNKYEVGEEGVYLSDAMSTVNVVSEEYIEGRFCLKRQCKIMENKGAVNLAYLHRCSSVQHEDEEQ